MNVALIRKLRGSLMRLGHIFLTCHQWVFVQPGTGRRPVDWCRNEMSVLYVASEGLIVDKTIKHKTPMIGIAGKHN